MTTTTIEPRKDTRSAEFHKYTADKHIGLAELATKMADLNPPHREDWLQLAHNHKLSAAEAETRRATAQQADEVSKLLSSHLYGAAAEWVTNLLAERDALLEENTRLKNRAEAKTTSGYEERRENLAEILKAVERDGLSGPRDLDVALDAIEALFNDDVRALLNVEWTKNE